MFFIFIFTDKYILENALLKILKLLAVEVALVSCLVQQVITRSH